MKNNSLNFAKKTITSTNKSSCNITQLEYAFIVFVLKKLSDENHPLSASTVTDYISQLTGKLHTEKTILRKLQALCSLQFNPNSQTVNNMLWLTFGGSIIEVSNEHKKNIIKKQSHFYFKPLMTLGELSLVCGAITSNRYLSSQEKNYLLSREMTMTNLDPAAGSLSSQIDAIVSSTAACDKGIDTEQISVYKSSVLLKHVNHLYDAITNGYMIEIIYGIYDLDEDLRRMHFHARNHNKPYRLNPYALLWNSGAFYLLATHDGHDNPVHFRVDRIISIKTVKTEDDATINQTRKPLPDMLKPFFTTKGHTIEFLPEKYTATYPLMGIYNNANYQDCFIECTASTLSILIDNFGVNLRIYPSHVPHDENELDFHGNPQHFLIAGIREVQYDNMVQFCLQQHTSITAIYPPKLVEDVKGALQASSDRYNKLSEDVMIRPKH